MVKNRWINFVIYISPIIANNKDFANYNIFRIASLIWDNMTINEQNAFDNNSNISQQVILLQLQNRDLFNYNVLFNNDNDTDNDNDTEIDNDTDTIDIPENDNSNQVIIKKYCFKRLIDWLCCRI